MDDRGLNGVREYLVSDEPVKAAADGQVLDSTPGGTVSLGLTDRRVVFVSEDGGFLDIDYDHICSVRSQPRTAVSVRGNDYRLLLVGGFVLGIVGLLGVLGVASNPLSPVFTLLFVGGIGVAERAVRLDEDVTIEGVDPIARLRRLDGRFDWDAVEAKMNGLNGHSPGAIAHREKRRVNEYVGDRQLLLAGSVVLAFAPFIALVVFESSLLAPVFALFTAGGIALLVYGFRHGGDLQNLQVVREREREVSIDVVDGRTVNLRVDPDVTVDRKLSRLAHGEESVSPDPPTV
jgi:hypothetical protein